MHTLPKQVTLTLKLHVGTGWNAGQIIPFCSDMSAHGYVYLGDVDVTVAVPQVDVRARMLERLREEKKTLLAMTQVKANDIDERIQSLLALEHQVEVVS